MVILKLAQSFCLIAGTIAHRVWAFPMAGQMAWLAGFGSATKILHVRDSADQPWKPYTASPYRVPDLQIKGASKGYTTMQALLKRNWVLVSTEEALKVELASFSPNVVQTIF